MGKAASNKAKGMKGQGEIVETLLQFTKSLGHEFTEDDFRGATSGAPGEDILMSSAARKVLPFCMEVKRSKKSTLEGWMEQARGHGKYAPIVFSRQDHKKWNVTVEIDKFFEIYQYYLEHRDAVQEIFKK